MQHGAFKDLFLGMNSSEIFRVIQVTVSWGSLKVEQLGHCLSLKFDEFASKRSGYYGKIGFGLSIGWEVRRLEIV